MNNPLLKIGSANTYGVDCPLSKGQSTPYVCTEPIFNSQTVFQILGELLGLLPITDSLIWSKVDSCFCKSVYL